MARRQGGTLGTFTPLSTPNAPTDLSVSTSIGSASVSFTAPTDTGDGAITSYIVTAVNESTGASTGATGTESPITISPGGGTFKIRAQAVNGFGPGRLSEFSTGNDVFSGAELYGFGDNSPDGRLGDGTIDDRSSPVQVGALTNWAQASAGARHSAAVKTDGTVWAWGSGNEGALGDGTVIAKSSPVQIGALTTWYQISAGFLNCVALKTDGSLWAWGMNDSGQLGDGTTAAKSSPVQIGALTTWVQVSTSINKHTGAIKSDGTIWMWGSNINRQLGIVFETANKSSPVQIGSLSNWAQVDTGGPRTAAVKTDGTLWSWGSNSNGALGDGTTVQRDSPVQIGALTNWYEVSAGGITMSAVKTDGTLWSWGNNIRGTIGDGTTVNKSSPVAVGALTNWKTVSLGDQHATAIKTDGTLWTWGSGRAGRLGDGTVVYRSSPIQVGALTNWAQSSGGDEHSLALLGVV